VHPDDRDSVVRRIEAGRASLKGWNGEYRVIWPDASVHWVRTHVTVQHEGGKPTHMLGIISDITQQKAAEEARLNAQRLEAENRQILEANRIKSQFLANMSHELRTPLNAIIGFADLLQSGAVDADVGKRRVFLGHIGASGRHLLRLINDLLDLSKVESGRFEFHPEPVDLAPLVKDVTDTLSPASQAKHIAVSTQIDPALNDLVLDPARMKQVLYNYLSNAIKFTPDRGHVTVRARAEGLSRFRLEVEDTGIGIAADDLPRLFTEFQQLDATLSKRHQGTGLGLALTRRLIEAQGGTVGVRSEPGVGSVFHLVLDRAPDTRALPVERSER
jgi:signal transduction histidine kinase